MVGHPEMSEYRDIMERTIREPAVIQLQGDPPDRQRYYRLTGRIWRRLDDIYCVVVVAINVARETGDVITSFLTDRLKEGDIVWLQRT